MAQALLARAMMAMSIALASGAAGAQSTFRITQVFSSLDGAAQFVELTESAGLNGQHHFAGLTLTSTHNGISKQFVFQNDLRSESTAYMSIIVSTDTPWLSGWDSNYYLEASGLPPRFVPTGGGTIDFAGIDSVSYASLPSDGIDALYRDRTIRQATIPRPCVAPCERYEIDWSYVVAWEYYSAALDHYFVTALALEIDALETGRLAGWTPTGYGFPVRSVGSSNGVRGNYPVCRFYMPPGEGDSHFFSASAEECEAVAVRFPDFTLETPSAFYVPVSDPATGTCPADDGSGVFGAPVFRLWNQRADSNHRYTSSEAIRDEMLSRGYVYEGIAWCYWTSVWDY